MAFLDVRVEHGAGHVLDERRGNFSKLFLHSLEMCLPSLSERIFRAATLAGGGRCFLQVSRGGILMRTSGVVFYDKPIIKEWNFRIRLVCYIPPSRPTAASGSIAANTN